MAESIDKYIGEVQEKVNELLVETGSPPAGLSRNMSLELCLKKSNLGEEAENAIG